VKPVLLPLLGDKKPEVIDVFKELPTNIPFTYTDVRLPAPAVPHTNVHVFAFIATDEMAIFDEKYKPLK